MFLRANIDMFAWKPSDMPGVPRDKIEHELKIYQDSMLVKQRLRRFTEFKKKLIKIEIEKLLAARFIKEVFHPVWLANPVLAEKKNGKWRMCVDYTDLNRNCPKDPSACPELIR